MEQTAGSRITVFGVAAAALLSTGCSLVGLGVGAALDGKRNRAAKTAYLQGFEVSRIKPGARLTLVLTGGERIAGRYEGLDTAPVAAEYGPRYARARADVHELALPDLGERVILQTVSGSATTGAFAGFDLGQIVLQPDGEARTVRLTLQHLATLTLADGTALSGPRLEALAADRRLPLVSRIVLGESRVPLEQVKSVEFRPQSHQGRATGLVVGAVIDAIVVASAMDSLNGSWGEGWCNNCSLLLRPDAGRR